MATFAEMWGWFLALSPHVWPVGLAGQHHALTRVFPNRVLAVPWPAQSVGSNPSTHGVQGRLMGKQCQHRAGESHFGQTAFETTDVSKLVNHVESQGARNVSLNTPSRGRRCSILGIKLLPENCQDRSCQAFLLTIKRWWSLEMPAANRWSKATFVEITKYI